jgi:hypothetical protein
LAGPPAAALDRSVPPQYRLPHLSARLRSQARSQAETSSRTSAGRSRADPSIGELHGAAAELHGIRRGRIRTQPADLGTLARREIGALFAIAGVDGAWMVERALKEQPTVLGHSYRRLAQTLGTEWGRQQLGADFWLHVAGLRLACPELAVENVVISDIRFPNEAQWLQQRGGVLVRVLRDSTRPVAPHSSENHADTLPATHELWNLGSLATLHDQVDRLIDNLRK